MAQYLFFGADCSSRSGEFESDTAAIEAARAMPVRIKSIRRLVK